MFDLAYQDQCKQIILAGDLNSDPASREGKRLERFCDTNSLTVHINVPTRITENSSTILDQFLSNIPEKVINSNVLAPLSTNDHCTITLTLSFKKQKAKAYKRLTWLYKRADFDGMNRYIKNFEWETCFGNDNIDISCQNWTTSFLNIARQFILNKVVEIRPRDAAWYNSELRKLKRQKDRAHVNAKSTHKAEDWATFRSIRNNYTSRLRETESNYKQSLALSLQNSQHIQPKQWWHITKQFMGENKDSVIPPMEHNNYTYFDEKEKADAFNKAFLSFSQLNLDQAALPELIYKTDSRLSNIIIHESEVLDILNSLDTSKATGPDGISAKMLKETATSVAPSLTKLFQISLKKGKIPKLWKEANVLPLHKKGDKTSFANYRPISLLSIVSKVYEKLIFKHVYNYLRDNDLISIHQSGFTPGDSTINQLLYMYDLFCKALNDKKDVRIVFCDQSKAFDRVWHEGILYKLQCLGITGPLLEWFSNYLKDRKQRVIINGICSEFMKILAGVPQGSVLGPLLFLIFINDITDDIRAGIKLFADDTCLYIIFETNNAGEATDTLNSDLDTVNKWAKKWLVTFNPQKTKSLYVSLKNNLNPPRLIFDGHYLDNIDSHKHLGLELNSKLTWKNHIDSITSTADKKLNLLTHLKHTLDRQTLLIMYQSFIRPSLEYGNIIWCNISEAECESLDKVQRRAARIITGGTISTSVRCLYQELSLETLQSRRDRHILLMFHKIVNNNVPSYLVELKPIPVNQRQNYNLRRENMLTMPKCRLTKYQRSFLPTAIKLWNTLPPFVKVLDYDRFKAHLEKSIPDENPLFQIGNRKDTINMARLRMNCSVLNSHLFNINVIDSARCACGYECEDTVHYFISCPLYNGPRAVLHNIVSHITPFALRTLLFGCENLNHNDNKIIYEATILYVKQTRRFDPP